LLRSVAHRVRISSIVLFLSLDDAGGAVPVMDDPKAGLVAPKLLAGVFVLAGAAEAAVEVVGAADEAAAGAALLAVGFAKRLNPPPPDVAAGVDDKAGAALLAAGLLKRLNPGLAFAAAGAEVVAAVPGACGAGALGVWLNRLSEGAEAGVIDGAAVLAAEVLVVVGFAAPKGFDAGGFPDPRVGILGALPVPAEGVEDWEGVVREKAGAAEVEAAEAAGAGFFWNRPPPVEAPPKERPEEGVLVAGLLNMPVPEAWPLEFTAPNIGRCC
jgi:hypothetical protein